MAIMGASTIAFLLVNRYNWLAFAMCFMWGFADSAVATHSQEILGFEFGDDSNSDPYAGFYFLQSLFATAIQLIQSLVDSRTSFLAYSSAVCALGPVTMLLTFFLFKFNRR